MAAIVLVTFNSAEVIAECLAACCRLPAQIVVVDNASVDRTVQLARNFPVQVISNAQNVGFAAAVNQGIRIIDDETVLILNPDTVPLSGFRDLVDAVSSKNVGAAGGLLIDSFGHPQEGFYVRGFPTTTTLIFEAFGLNRLWPGNPVNRRYRHPIGSDNTQPVEVDQPAGAFLMVRREAWAEIGGFDEGFCPIWFEDVDFCRRVQDAGYKILFVPSAVAQHRGGHSASRLRWSSRQLIWYGSLLRYSSKHFSRTAQLVLAVALRLAWLPRMIFGFFVTRSLEPLWVYLELLRLASTVGKEKSVGS